MLSRYILLIVFLSSGLIQIQAAQRANKYKTAKKVFDSLVEARGIRNVPIPEFVFSEAERNVAWSDYKNKEVGLEEKAFDICMTFGSDSLNALASILSHELTHYYEKHGWTEQFISKVPLNKNLTSTDESHYKMEWQADYLGGLLAHIAGYNTLSMMPQFLDKIYQGYNLRPDLASYPSLSERKVIAKEALEKCEQLTNVYDFALYLTAIGEFQTSQLYYNFILNDFQSREIYNNLGVALMSEFLSISDSKKVKYQYPFELDAKSRLSSSDRGASGDFQDIEERKIELINLAEEAFRTAINLDEFYHLSYLNLACTYSISGEIDDSEYYLKKGAKRVIEDNEKDYYKILEAILLDQTGNPQKALKLLDQLENMKESFIVNINLDAINGDINNERTEIEKSKTPKSHEIIGESSLNFYVKELLRENLKADYSLTIDKKTVFAFLEKNQSLIYIQISTLEGKYIIIQRTVPDYIGTTRQQNKKGDSYTHIQENYGEPSSFLLLNNKSLFVYQDYNMVFDINKKNELCSWLLYTKN